MAHRPVLIEDRPQRTALALIAVTAVFRAGPGVLGARRRVRVAAAR